MKITFRRGNLQKEDFSFTIWYLLVSFHWKNLWGLEFCEHGSLLRQERSGWSMVRGSTRALTVLWSGGTVGGARGTKKRFSGEWFTCSFVQGQHGGGCYSGGIGTFRLCLLAKGTVRVVGHQDIPGPTEPVLFRGIMLRYTSIHRWHS